MRTNNFRRVAALSLALAAPAFGSAHANSIDDYSYARDVWPQIQAQQTRGIYDQHDRYVDQRTGDPLPGAPHTGF